MGRRRTPNRKLLLLSKLFFAAAVIVLLFGFVITWNHFKAGEANGNNQNASTHQAAPSTEKPSDNAFRNHQAAPDEPRYIFIPKLSVQAIVKPVGVTPNNLIASPSNVHDVGWYTGSAKPDQAGAMLLDGHVSSWNTPGIFFDLKRLEPGDKITIESGDGQKFNYQVMKSETYQADKVDMLAALAPVNADRPGLNLITCAGEVIEGTNEFDQRIVVFTEQID
jgi:sortase (surface protein transpeptidase)